MKFIVPVIYTISGHMEIEADDIDAAKKLAAQMNDEGVELDMIIDPCDESEVCFEEVCELCVENKCGAW